MVRTLSNMTKTEFDSNIKALINNELSKYLGPWIIVKLDGTVYKDQNDIKWHAFTVKGCSLQLWATQLSGGQLYIVNNLGSYKGPK